jgi:hypothetical protein
MQIVVEPKQELPFEIARGSQGGAAEGVAGNRHKTDWPSHFVEVCYLQGKNGHRSFAA